jgi:hypothetical protein
MYFIKRPVYEKQYLNGQLPSIPINKLPVVPNSNSIRYSYVVWVYVNSLNNITPCSKKGENGNIFQVLDGEGPYNTCENPLFSLDINKSTQLNGKIALKTPTTTDKSEVVPITTNFPVQKWAHLILSVDNNILDIYLDGKIIQSKVLPSLPAPFTNLSKSYIDFGRGDIYIVNFRRLEYPMDPQTAWSLYMSGNGQSTAGLATYGLNMSVTSNNEDYYKFPLF